MPAIFAAAAVTLGAWVAITCYWVWRYSPVFGRRSSFVPADGELPKAAVVLSLRGADPFLDRCLKGLLSQDYPDYDVRIVIDNELDPAWETVRLFVAECGKQNVHVESLTTRHTTCSLKISSLLQAVAGLDSTFDVVVVVDADVVPHASWLRDLVGPMHDTTVGATTGIRWYMPGTNNLGTLVRYLWNSAAIQQMHAFGIGWGGSLAIRRELFSNAHLSDKWSKILFEDTFTANEIRKLGYKLEFVPAATMVNREFIDLRSALHFISRQMLNVRLYHDSWLAILWMGIISTLALAVVLGTGAYAALTGDWTIASLAGAVVTAYSSSLLVALARWESWVRRTMRARGDTVSPLSWKLLWAVPVTQISFMACLCTALWTRKVEWRGVTYRLHGPSRIRMVEYRPYQPANSDFHAPVSL
jgi:cellulose synthase/poly-beta-1,6-N-acetylglucosamine synthase-like glycosyltransferase